MLQNPIEHQKNPVTWENFASTTGNVLDLFKNSNIPITDFRIADPSKIDPHDSVIVSIFLYNISQNPSIKAHTISTFSEPEKQYCFSENILQFLITVHSEEHMLSMNAVEKLLGVIYSNPTIDISNEIKEAHLKINLSDNPIEVWDKLFPSYPYRLSILLNVHGPGVTYKHPEKKHKSINSYDSTEDPDDLF